MDCFGSAKHLYRRRHGIPEPDLTPHDFGAFENQRRSLEAEGKKIDIDGHIVEDIKETKD